MNRMVLQVVNRLFNSRQHRHAQPLKKSKQFHLSSQTCGCLSYSPGTTPLMSLSVFILFLRVS